VGELFLEPDMMPMPNGIWRDRRGNVIVMAAAALPLLIGCAGLATDTIQWTLWKRQLQRAADSAALAGVYDRVNSAGSTATVASTVAHDLTLNQHTWMSNAAGYPVVTYPADSGVKTNQVSVGLAVQQSLPFSSLFMTTAPMITATSTAATIPAGGDACIEALESNASFTGITNSGNTTVSAPNCIMYSNSPSTNSASAGGSSSVNVKAIAAVGGISQSNNWTVQQYLPYSPALPDPFANVTPDPNAMVCSAAALDQNTNIAAAIAAGTNCWSSLSVGANRTLNMTGFAGPIYINGGSADLKGTFNCTGCTIVLTNKSTAANAPIGTLSSNAQASNNISAPTSGTFKGLAIYQDRRATGNTDKINGGSGSVVTGAVYFPNDVLWINGSGGATALCAMWVARRIVFTGNSSITLKNQSDSACAASGMPASSAINVVRLVA
jgi:Flp pilus assembly protein TadG